MSHLSCRYLSDERVDLGSALVRGGPLSGIHRICPITRTAQLRISAASASKPGPYAPLGSTLCWPATGLPVPGSRTEAPGAHSQFTGNAENSAPYSEYGLGHDHAPVGTGSRLTRRRGSVHSSCPARHPADRRVREPWHRGQVPARPGGVPRGGGQRRRSSAPRAAASSTCGQPRLVVSERRPDGERTSTDARRRRAARARPRRARTGRRPTTRTASASPPRPPRTPRTPRRPRRAAAAPAARCRAHARPSRSSRGARPPGRPQRLTGVGLRLGGPPQRRQGLGPVPQRVSLALRAAEVVGELQRRRRLGQPLGGLARGRPGRGRGSSAASPRAAGPRSPRTAPRSARTARRPR